MGRGRTRRFNFLKLLILNDKNMKKEYVTPSLKVMMLNLEAVVLAASGEQVTGGVSLTGFEASNSDEDGETVNWDF
jgi:hypothetical protein